LASPLAVSLLAGDCPRLPPAAKFTPGAGKPAATPGSPALPSTVSAARVEELNATGTHTPRKAQKTKWRPVLEDLVVRDPRKHRQVPGEQMISEDGTNVVMQK
jgi:hypothetical protein